MSSRYTLEEPAPAGGRRRRLLCVVLDYDDLLADRTGVVPLRGGPLRLGRADEDPGAGRGWSARGDSLRIADRWLSGAHAVLEPGSGGEAGVVLRDLGSRNGTYVNGQRISAAPLADGDLIEVGHTLLCYRDVAAPARASSGSRVSVTGNGSSHSLRDPGEELWLGPTRTLCPEVAALVRDLARVAPSREAVLLLAETGAGKEVAAELIHQLSGRPGAFVAVDCGAVPESLFESAFFGHQRGAFTGAAAAQVGYLQRAHRGTLFLDEVANMSPAAQAKLLRVLEDGLVTPLGAERAIPVDARVVAATNLDLLAVDAPSPGIAAPAGFRPDLLRRLAGYVGRIPPLRSRREDLGYLSAYLLRQAGVARAAISAAAARRLFNSAFPGNVRELRAVLRSAALLASGDVIDLAHLGALATPAPREPAGGGPGLRDFVGTAVYGDLTNPREAGEAGKARGAGWETARRDLPSRAELEQALQATGGNVVHAARRLGTHPRQLYRWIERYGLVLSQYRGER